MSKILVASIREFGRALKNAPIYSFQPRKLKKISDSTKGFLKQHNVDFIDEELNRKYQYYPLANKPLVCAWAEENVSSEILVFLDSDTVFLNEPKRFLAIDENEVLLKPVDLKGVGSDGNNDSNATYWKQLYSLLDVSCDDRVTTLIDQKEILPYWNSGQIAVKRSTGLFGQWMKNFEQVISAKLTPNNGLFFVEQSTLSATVVQMGVKVYSEDLSYNYPIHLHNELDYKGMDLTRSVSWHYHDLFNRPKRPHYIEEFFSSSAKGRWLKEKIEEHDLTVSSLTAYYEKLNQLKNNFIFRHIG